MMSINFEAIILDDLNQVVAKIDLGSDLVKINNDFIRILWGDLEDRCVSDLINKEEILEKYPDIEDYFKLDLTSLIDFIGDRSFYSLISTLEDFNNEKIKDYLEARSVNRNIKEYIVQKAGEKDIQLTEYVKALLGLSSLDDTIQTLLDSFPIAKKGDIDDISKDIINLVDVAPEKYLEKAYPVIGAIYAEELITKALKSNNISKDYKNEIYEKYFNQMRGAIVSNIRNLSYTSEMLSLLLKEVSPQEVLYMCENNELLNEVQNRNIKDVVDIIVDLKDIYNLIEQYLIYLRPDQIQKIVSRSNSVDITDILAKVNLATDTIVSIMSSGDSIDDTFFGLPISHKDRYLFNLAIANYQPRYAGIESNLLGHPFLSTEIIEKYPKKFSSMRTLGEIYKHRKELFSDKMLSFFKKKTIDEMNFRFLAMIKEWTPEENETIRKKANKNASTSFSFFAETEKNDPIRSKLITKMVGSPRILGLLVNNKDSFTEEELDRIYARISKSSWADNNWRYVLQAIPKSKYNLLIEKYSHRLASIDDIYDILNESEAVEMIKRTLKSRWYSRRIPKEKIIICFELLDESDPVLPILFNEFIKDDAQMRTDKKLLEVPYIKNKLKNSIAGYTHEELKEMSHWAIGRMFEDLSKEEGEKLALFTINKLGHKISEIDAIAKYIDDDLLNKVVKKELKDNSEISIWDDGYLDRINNEVFSLMLRECDAYDLTKSDVAREIKSRNISISEIIDNSSKIDSEDLTYYFVESLEKAGITLEDSFIENIIKKDERCLREDISNKHIHIFKKVFKGNNEKLAQLIDSIDMNEVKNHFSDEEIIKIRFSVENYYIDEFINPELIPEDKLDLNSRRIEEVVILAGSNRYKDKVLEYVVNVDYMYSNELDKLVKIYGNDFLNDFIAKKIDEEIYRIEDNVFFISSSIEVASFEKRLNYKKGVNETNKKRIKSLMSALEDATYNCRLNVLDKKLDLSENDELINIIEKEGLESLVDSTLAYILDSSELKLDYVPVRIEVNNSNISITPTGDFLGTLYSNKLNKIKQKVIEKSEEFSMELNNLTSNIDRKFAVKITPDESISSDLVRKGCKDVDSTRKINAGTRATKHHDKEWRITKSQRLYRGYRNYERTPSSILSPIMKSAEDLNEIKAICERLADANVGGDITISISVSDFYRKIESLSSVAWSIRDKSSLLNPFINNEIDIEAPTNCNVQFDSGTKMILFHFNAKITYDNIVNFIELAVSLVKASIYKDIGKMKDSKDMMASLSNDAFLRKFHNDVENSEEMNKMLMLYEIIGGEI